MGRVGAVYKADGDVRSWWQLQLWDGDLVWGFSWRGRFHVVEGFMTWMSWADDVFAKETSG